jgi:hypothetical protein
VFALCFANEDATDDADPDCITLLCDGSRGLDKGDGSREACSSWTEDGNNSGVELVDELSIRGCAPSPQSFDRLLIFPKRETDSFCF